MAEPTDEIQALLNFLLPQAERMLGEGRHSAVTSIGGLPAKKLHISAT
jgi:hypothetical protein